MAVALCAGTAFMMMAGVGVASAKLTARYTSRPLTGVSNAALRRMSAAGTTVPVWSASTSTLGHTYSYSMVGKNPRVHQTTPSSTVPTDLIPIIIKIGTNTFNPTTTGGCPPTASASTLTQQSPVFQKYDHAAGGTYLGNVQYVNGSQRENFAKYIFGAGAVNPGYHVVLGLTVRRAITVTVPTADGSILTNAACGPLGAMDINWWDNYVQNTLLPGAAKNDTNPTRFPFFLFNNVVMYDGSTSNCCIIGYHSAYSRSDFGGAVQTYGNGDYESTGLFSGLADVGAISHEVAEWLDDPYGNNATPAWGHIGQVSGCQANLEVGDPLSGTSISQAMPNGVTYHPQELAFWSWFYRERPSIGLHGWFSSNGTFKTAAGPVCT